MGRLDLSPISPKYKLFSLCVTLFLSTWRCDPPKPVLLHNSRRHHPQSSEYETPPELCCGQLTWPCGTLLPFYSSSRLYQTLRLRSHFCLPGVKKKKNLTFLLPEKFHPFTKQLQPLSLQCESTLKKLWRPRINGRSWSPTSLEPAQNVSDILGRTFNRKIGNLDLELYIAVRPWASHKTSM